MKRSLLLFFLLFTTQFAIAEEVKELNWIGCGITKKAFMKSMAIEYERVTGIKVNLNGGGATKGIRKISSGEMDIGGSCRHKLYNHNQEVNTELHPVAWDALVIIVNNNNPVTSITREQIKQLYLGKITNWQELGGVDEPINLMIRKGKISGVGFAMRKLIFADSTVEFVSDNIFPSTGPLEKAIEKDEYAIGITGISSARKRNVKMLSLNEKYPTYENIKNGVYSLYRPLYLVSNPSSPNSKAVKKFIKFAQSAAGREIIRKNEVVPYFDALKLAYSQFQQDMKAYSEGY